MNVHEYQAKQLLHAYGVPIPSGKVAATPEEALRVAEDLGGDRVVLKAQVHAGGRGKGGGIRVVGVPQDVVNVADAMIGMTLVTHQTGPEGKRVRKLLVEEVVSIDKEFYLALTLDRKLGTPVVIASSEGGMDIEEVAAARPDRILTLPLLPGLGYRSYHGVRVARFLGFDKHLAKELDRTLRGLVRLFLDKDCSLAEVNPLALLDDGRLVAADAKLNFDESALYRHPDVADLRDLDEEDPLDVEASRQGLSYVHLDGTIGCMVNGAGLAMATMDIIKLHGGEPANFLDVGGGATAERVAHAFRILLSDDAVRAVLVNIFGGIMRCDVLAEGIIRALAEVEVDVPVVVRMKGTNYEQGRQMLEASPLSFVIAEHMDEAAAKVVAAAEGGVA